MKYILSFFCLFTSLVFANVEVREFFQFATDSRSRIEICDTCFEIEKNSPTKVQPKILSSLTSFIVESNPYKAVEKIKEAITIHDSAYSEKEGYSKRKSKLTILLSMYEKTLSEMEAEIEKTSTPEELEKWKLGNLDSHNEDVDNMVVSGQHAPAFKGSFFEKIILEFEGL